MDTNDLDMATVVELDNVEVAVGDLFEQDMSGVSAFFGFELLPHGVYDLATGSAEAKTMETKTGTKAVIAFSFTVTAVHAVKDKSVNQEELIGREYNELIFINNALRDIGKVRALVESAGGVWGSNLLQNLATFQEQIPGMTAGVTNSYHKATDRTYANLDYKSIKPLVTGAAEQSAGVKIPF